MENRTFNERINDKSLVPLAKSFIEFIYDLAIENNKTRTEIWHLWQDYSHTCTNYDQSPVKTEFVHWYKLKYNSDYLQTI